MINVRARSQIDCIKMIGGAEQLEEVEVTATSELREKRAGEQVVKAGSQWVCYSLSLCQFIYYREHTVAGKTI